MIQNALHNNIKLAGTTKYNPSAPVQMEEGLAHVVNKLAEKRLGKWEFLGVSVSTSNHVYRFNVFEADTFIGSIAAESEYFRRKQEYVYTLCSKNIKKERGARNELQTTDPVVAVRKALQVFKLPSLQDKMEEARLEARNTTTRVRSRVYDAKSTILNKIGESRMQSYIVDRLDDFRKFISASDPSFNTAVLDRLPEAIREEEIVDSVLYKREPIIVVQNGDSMHCLYKDLITTYSEGDEIPEHIRRKLGTLKLVEDSQFVEDVGAKVSNSIFYIVDEEQ